MRKPLFTYCMYICTSSFLQLLITNRMHTANNHKMKCTQLLFVELFELKFITKETKCSFSFHF